MVLRRKPESFHQAIIDATEMELGLIFGTGTKADVGETGVHAVAATPLPQNESINKLQQTLEAVSKHLEHLESKLQDASYTQQRPCNLRRRSHILRAGLGGDCCFLCHE